MRKICNKGHRIRASDKQLADLGTVMPNVYHTKEEMIDCVNAFYEGMVQRSEEMKRHPNYKTGENYAYLGLPPCFLIFDEYVAFFEMLGTKESVSLLSQLKKIVIVLFSVLVKSYTGVLLGTGGSVLGVYLISFFPKAWKYTPTTLMESASLLIGTKSIEDYGIAVLITILLVVICLIVSITVMNRKQL